ncbi:MAG: ATP-binding cassette, subfamily multidrug efflux pump, partial [Actinomycetota bacterium]|nr:ATP-binding cassette, subfamily multidrug efflux pump [Actinomycetota bacterium]
MLMRLLKSHLRPYRRALLLIVVLQTVQTSAALTLPTINARIIDNGVLKGNTHYIYTWGAIMLFFALVQVAFS